jgi:hypothetical protein
MVHCTILREDDLMSPYTAFFLGVLAGLLLALLTRNP